MDVYTLYVLENYPEDKNAILELLPEYSEEDLDNILYRLREGSDD